MSIIEEQL